MEWIIPGTVITQPMEEADHLEQKLEAMFLGGGMVLSQVAAVTGLEPYTIQNWVKRGFLTKPQQKKYDLEQLCRILTINMLKDALPMEEICGLLEYINGDLDDESDDLVDDNTLYFMFTKLAVHHRKMQDPVGRDAYIREVLADYAEPVPGARKRVEKVLNVMLTAWAAAQLRRKAMTMVIELNEEVM